MRVVDDHRLLVAVVHLPVQPQQVAGVELVERGRPGGVEHRDEPLGAVAALGAGDDAAGLVRVVLPGVRHDGVVGRAVDAQHGASLGAAPATAARTAPTGDPANGLCDRVPDRYRRCPW